MNKGNWKPSEDAFLKANYAGKQSIPELARNLHRSENATYRRAIALGLTPSRRARREWKHKDIEYIRQNYTGKRSLSRLAKKLNRTETAIYHKAIELGKAKSIHRKRWNENEKQFLRDHYRTMTYEAIGNKLNRSTSAVSSMARRLGLKKNTPR